MPAKNKMVKQLSAVYLVRDTPTGGGTSTLSAATVAGAATFVVVSAVNIAIGDTLRVGSGEEMELVRVSGVATNTITPSAPLVYAHAAGEPVVEQTVYDLGDITEGGVEVNIGGESREVPVATRRLAFTTLQGYVSASARFSLPTFTLHNLLVALGMPLSGVTGVGTAVSPFHLATDGNELNADLNQSLIVISVLEDGTFFREELWGVDADYSGFSTTLNRGELTPVPASFVASAGGIATTVASPYVASSTYKAGKGKVFDALTEVGMFLPATVGPLATTTTAAAAAGATALVLTAITNLAAGDWIAVNSGDMVEFHQVDSIVTLTANLRTKLLRAQPSGTTVVRQTSSVFGGVHEDGVDLSLSGSMAPVRIATRRFQAGLRPQGASFAVGFKVVDITLENLARALGIPQSAIAAGRLPFNNNIGSATTDGIYVRGVLQDGSTVQVNFWGCSTDIGSVGRTLSNNGVSSIPMSFKPSSGIQFVQYS